MISYYVRFWDEVDKGFTSETGFIGGQDYNDGAERLKAYYGNDMLTCMYLTLLEDPITTEDMNNLLAENDKIQNAINSVYGGDK